MTFSAAITGGCKSNKKMPAMNQVEMSSKNSAAPNFEFSKIDVQHVNGKLSMAIVSQQGSMLQLNDLPFEALKNGKVSSAAYRLVFMPGGFQAACPGNAAKNRLSLTQLAENKWEVSLRGEISCGTETFSVKLLTNMEVPPPVFVAPNQP